LPHAAAELVAVRGEVARRAGALEVDGLARSASAFAAAAFFEDALTPLQNGV